MPEEIELDNMNEPSTRSSSSQESTVSRAFDELDQQARMLPDYEDLSLEGDTAPTIVTTKRFKRSWVIGVVIVFILGYTAVLLSYRNVNYDARTNYSLNNTSAAESVSSVGQSASVDSGTEVSTISEHLIEQESSSSTQPEESTTSRTPTVTLQELDVRISRESIPKKVYHSRVDAESVTFLPGARMPKAEDEGLYIQKYDDKVVLRKMADPQYEYVLYPEGTFTYNGLENILLSVVSNSDGQLLLFASEAVARFRHSAEAFWYLYDVSTKEITQISGKGLNGVKLQHCSFSPKARYVTFIQEGDLYIYDVANKSNRRITNDGDGYQIFNGKTDWVYEEEVLGTDNALWWNQDETRLAFLKIDDTDVETLPLERFSSGVFPTVEDIKYPKPGEVNPKLTLFIHDTERDQTDTVDRSDSKLGEEWICYGALWIGDSFIIRESDRTSKVLDYRVVSKDDGSSIKYSIDSNEYNGWIENFNEMVFIPKNESSSRVNHGFVDIVQSEGYNHLAFFPVDSVSPRILTKGDWEVVSIEHFDAEEELVYITANRESHFESHIYAVNVNTGEIFSITDISKPGFFTANYSPSGRYVVASYKGPELPRMIVYDTTIEHKEKEKRAIDFTGSRTRYHTVKLSDGETVDVIEVVPPNFDASKEHPLLVNVYGGPGYRMLHRQFHMGFEDTISQALDAVILFVDPRGTGGQGWNYRSYAKRHIGHWEPRDVTEVTKLWIESRTYINPEKTAIWGWSYGGFTTLKTMEYDKGQVFKFGMVVAPVTNWLMYDSIYTERYMDLPKDNSDGYKEARIRDLEAFKSVKRFVLMHGTGDDNVHIQNTYKLLDLFNLHAVVNFDLMIYPDSNHNINYHNSYGVLMNRLTTWLRDKFEL